MALIKSSLILHGNSSMLCDQVVMKRREGRSTYLVLAALWAGLAGALAGPACLITSAPQFPPPSAVKPEGSCMCSVCWTKPFCWDETLPEGQQFYGTPPCAHKDDEAVESARIVDSIAAKEAEFFCWSPFDKAQMKFPSKECPTNKQAHENSENLDPCVDLPACAQPPAQCGGATSDPACPEQTHTARPTKCVDVPDSDSDNEELALANGARAAVDALIESCALHGAEPPSGEQPERYCYLSCVSRDTCQLDSRQVCNGCDGTIWIDEPASAQSR